VKAPRVDVAIVAAGLALYVALAASAAHHLAATYDEGSHLPAGYTYLAKGDYRLNPEHPPLVKLLAAAPLRLLPVTMETEDVTWRARRQWEFGRRFLYRWNDADRLLFYGRLPIVGLGALLALAVYLWARRWEGRLAAAVALFLCVLSPDMLAHGSLVTTDVAIALFTFLAVAALARMRDTITLARAAAFALAVAFAFATKYSALLFVPILFVLAVLIARSRGRAALLAVVGVMASVTTYVVLWAAYGFRYYASPDHEPPLPWANVQPASPLVRGPAGFALEHHLLPESLVLGFLRVLKAAASRPSFLFGHLSTGFWYYFPATFAMKTPIPLLLLLAGAVVLAVRARGERVREAFLWLPPLAYMALAMMGRLNIGHRHLLPIYPYLFILAARAAARGLRSGHWAWRAGTAALLAWYAVGTLRVHPDYLSYFNELAGGPANGYRLLADSNVDWGQDLKDLKAWMDREGVPEVKLAYFGSADPDYYGIRGERLPGELRPARLAARIHVGDLVAISATNLAGVYLGDEPRRLLQRVAAGTPIARIGYSILVYRAREEYEVPDPGPPAQP
jgi:hypothetical protein